MTEHEKFIYYAKRFFEWAGIPSENEILDNADAITTDSLNSITKQINAISLWSFILKPWKLIPLFIFRWQANSYATQVSKKLPKQPALNPLEYNDNPNPNKVEPRKHSYRQVSVTTPQPSSGAEQINHPTSNGQNIEHQADEDQAKENMLDWLPIEIWTKNILTNVTPRDMAHLVLAGDKKMNEQIFLPELNRHGVSKILEHMKYGYLISAEKIIKANPKLLLSGAVINDKRITPLQWAIKHFNSYMLKVILELWPKGHEQDKIKQLQEFTSTDLLNCMQQNQFDAAEELIKTNPHLLLEKGINPLTGEPMTPLQWTYWQHDTHARKMLEKYWPEGEEQAKAAQATYFRYHMESLDHLVLTAKYDEYLDQFFDLRDNDNWDEIRRLEYAIAKALRHWPHVIAELTRKDRHMCPNNKAPKFNEKNLPRDCEYYDGSKIFPLQQDDGLGFTYTHKLFHGFLTGGGHIGGPGYNGTPTCVDIDRKGIAALFDVRIKETNAHIDSLLNVPRPQPQEEQPENNGVNLLWLPSELLLMKANRVPLKDHAAFAQTKWRVNNVLQPELNKIKDATLVLRMMQQNQIAEAEALIKANSKLLLVKGELDGEFITPLQWTYKQHDTHMRKMILRNWPEAEGKQYAMVAQAKDFRENMESQDPQLILGEYNIYLERFDDLWHNHSYTELDRLEYNIAKALRVWPHVIAELTRSDRHMCPKNQAPEFDEENLPRGCQYYDDANIFPLQNGVGLGFESKLFRGYEGRANPHGARIRREGVKDLALRDRAGIIALFEVRTTETKSHIDSLLNPSPKPQHPESSKDNSNNDSPYPNNAGHGEHSYGKVLRISPEAPPAAVPVNPSPVPNYQDVQQQPPKEQPEDSVALYQGKGKEEEAVKAPIDNTQQLKPEDIADESPDASDNLETKAALNTTGNDVWRYIVAPKLAEKDRRSLACASPFFNHVMKPVLKADTFSRKFNTYRNQHELADAMSYFETHRQDLLLNRDKNNRRHWFYHMAARDRRFDEFTRMVLARPNRANSDELTPADMLYYTLGAELELRDLPEYAHAAKAETLDAQGHEMLAAEFHVRACKDFTDANGNKPYQDIAWEKYFDGWSPIQLTGMGDIHDLVHLLKPYAPDEEALNKILTELETGWTQLSDDEREKRFQQRLEAVLEALPQKYKEKYFEQISEVIEANLVINADEMTPKYKKCIQFYNQSKWKEGDKVFVEEIGQWQREQPNWVKADGYFNPERSNEDEGKHKLGAYLPRKFEGEFWNGVKWVNGKLFSFLFFNLNFLNMSKSTGVETLGSFLGLYRAARRPRGGGRVGAKGAVSGDGQWTAARGWLDLAAVTSRLEVRNRLIKHSLEHVQQYVQKPSLSR